MSEDVVAASSGRVAIPKLTTSLFFFRPKAGSSAISPESFFAARRAVALSASGEEEAEDAVPARARDIVLPEIRLDQTGQGADHTLRRLLPENGQE